jgi:hypothetical protein
MALERVDELSQHYGLEATTGLKQFARAVQIAKGIQALRDVLTPQIMQHLMALQGSALGFRTDLDKGKGYPVEVVRECFIEATLRGFPTGCNCWNIISGRFYPTKEGYEFKVSKLPDVTDLKLNLGVPKMLSGGATVEARADFKLNGHADFIQRTFPIRVNAGMGADAVLGKATRKLLKAVHDYVLGSEHSIPDPEELPESAALTPAPAVLEPGRSSLRGPANGNGTPKPAADEQAQPSPSDNLYHEQEPPTGPDAPATKEQWTEIDQLIADKEVVVHHWRDDWKKRHNEREPQTMTQAEATEEISRLMESTGGE